MIFSRSYTLPAILCVCVIGAAIALMNISQDVYNKQRRVQQLSQNKLEKEWEIRALKAELAYLSRPERLEQIVRAIRDVQTVAPGGTTLIVSPATLHVAPSVATSESNPPLNTIQVQMEKPQTDNNAKGIKVNMTQTAKVVTKPSDEIKKDGKDFAALLETVGGHE